MLNLKHCAVDEILCIIHMQPTSTLLSLRLYAQAQGLLGLSPNV
jgi:hypothetical protein